jgi:hypothetical protein
MVKANLRYRSGTDFIKPFKTIMLSYPALRNSVVQAGIDAFTSRLSGARQFVFPFVLV